ncbi:MAG: hypothetical protein ABI867_24390 [Kofleriaceae bacterium]
MNRFAGLAFTLAACSESSAPAVPDSAVDATPARCDPSQPFGPPVPIPSLNTEHDDATLTLTADELTAVIGREVLPEPQPVMMFLATRADRDAAFEPATIELLGFVDQTGTENHPSLTGDGLTLYYKRRVPNRNELAVSTRRDVASPFTAATVVTVAGEDGGGNEPRITADGQRLYFGSATQLLMATRLDSPSAFAAPTPVSDGGIGAYALSQDELSLYHMSAGRMVLATRASTADVFAVPGAPVTAAPPGAFPLFLTEDDCILYVENRETGGGVRTDLSEMRRPR